MSKDRTVSHERSGCFAITLPIGDLATEVLDFGQKQWKVISVQCGNATPIQAATTMYADVDWGSGDLVNLYEQDDPSTQWSSTIPAAGKFGFIMTHAFGIKRLRLRVDKGPAADVIFKIVGHDALEK